MRGSGLLISPYGWPSGSWKQVAPLPALWCVARGTLLPKDRRGPERDSTVLVAPPPRIAKCPSTDEWVKKMWHIYTMEYYSAIKNEIMSFYNNMYGIRVYHSELRGRQLPYDITYR